MTLRQIRLSSRNRRNRPRGPLDISRVGNWAESSLFFVSRKLFAGFRLNHKVKFVPPIRSDGSETYEQIGRQKTLFEGARDQTYRARSTLTSRVARTRGSNTATQRRIKGNVKRRRSVRLSDRAQGRDPHTRRPGIRALRPKPRVELTRDGRRRLGRRRGEPRRRGPKPKGIGKLPPPRMPELALSPRPRSKPRRGGSHHQGRALGFRRTRESLAERRLASRNPAPRSREQGEGSDGQGCRR